MEGQRIYKFVFNALVQTVTLALKSPCLAAVNWRRGDKIAEVQERREIQQGVATFNEKLQLECNMNFQAGSKKFQEKKTKFTVLIFSERGNKQAGEVTYDVSEFLNAKQKELKVEKLLDKCPDKNAKLTFILTCYLKEEVQPDKVSQRSENTITNNVSIMAPSAVLQPDFKKKKPEQPPLPPGKEQRKQQKNDQQNQQQRVPMVNKANKQRIRMEEENRRLKQQLSELQQLQIQNTTLRKRYEQAEKRSQSYYTKKLQQVKKELAEHRSKTKQVEMLQQKKFDMEKEMCDCKEQMGRILNYAITSGNNQMAEEIYNIYQNSRP